MTTHPATSRATQREELDLVPSQLLDLVEKDVAAFFGSDQRARAIQAFLLKNPYSDVFRIILRLGDSPVGVYLKIPHITPVNRDVLGDRLRAEFEILHTLNSGSSADRPFGVIAPIALYPDIPAVATLEAPGRPLRAQYGRTARRIGFLTQRRALRDSVRNCGLWLQEFQKLTGRGVGRFDTDELITYTEVRIALLTENPRCNFSTAMGRKLVGTIQRIAENELASSPIAGRHNDFAGHNIANAGPSVRVLDFSMFDYGPTAYDPCNFWLDLEMLKYDWTYSRRLLSELQTSFLEAYGRIATDDAAFSLARVRYSLNRLLTTLDAQNRAWPSALYPRDAARALYEWLSNFISGWD